MDTIICTLFKLENGDIVYVDKEGNIIIDADDTKEIQNMIEFKQQLRR